MSSVQITEKLEGISPATWIQAGLTATLGGLLWWTIKHLHELRPIGLGLAVLCLSLPVILCALYEGMLRRSHENRLLRPGSLLHSLRSGYVLRLVFWTVAAPLLVGATLMRMNIYAASDWLRLSVFIPVCLMSFAGARYVLVENVSPVHLTRLTMASVRRIAPWAMVCLYAAWMGIAAWQGWHAAPSDETSLRAIVSERRTHLDAASATGSEIVRAGLYFLSVQEGARDYFLMRTEGATRWIAFGIELLSMLTASYVLCILISFVMTPPREFLRLLSADPAAVPAQRPSNARLAVMSAISVLVLLFILPSTFARLETAAGAHPEWMHKWMAIEERLFTSVEQIEGAYYALGTQDELDKLQNEILQRRLAGNEMIRRKVDQAFLEMELRVDDYLDWYYSLGGEYVRVAHALAGSIEQHMQNRLSSLLNSPTLNGIHEEARQMLALDQADYDRKRSEILEATRLDLKPDAVRIRSVVPELPGFSDISSELALARAGTTGFGATVAGMVAGKVAAKSAFKLAAKQLAKLGVSKLGGVAGGALLGSIVPGVGTLGGAILGGLLGLGMDYGLIKGEERIGRQTLKTEILASLRLEKLEFERRYLRPAAANNAAATPGT